MKLLHVYVLLLTVRPIQAATTDFVPKEILATIKTSLQPPVAQDFTKNALCFVSAESSYGLGVVENCIKEFPSADGTLWLMRQDIETAGGTRVDNLIATYVQTRPNQNPISYYLELDRSAFEANGNVIPMNYKVPCAMCHSSGPRLIRPQVASVKGFSAKEKQLFADFNKKISQYKIVETFTPAGKIGEGLIPRRKTEKKILTLDVCYECHNSKTGIRAELSSDQSGTIHYLAFASKTDLGQAQMPTLNASALSTEDSECLKQWLDGKVSASCVATKPSHSVIKDVSWLTARVETSLHSFNIAGLKLTGGRDSFSIGLSELKSGISARDSHIQKLFNVATHPTIQGAMGDVPKDKSTFVAPVVLQIGNIKNSVDVTFHCNESQSRCSIASTVDLEKFQLVMPRFLGISVNPKIHIDGEIVL